MMIFCYESGIDYAFISNQNIQCDIIISDNFYLTFNIHLLLCIYLLEGRKLVKANPTHE